VRLCLRSLVAAACAAATACAPALLKLPQGPGVPASDAGDAVAEATGACHGVRTFSAELAASGSIGGEGLRGRLLVGVAAPASARIEAVAPFGPPVFILVARGEDATLLLPREDRVIEHRMPQAVLEAITGVPIDAAELRTVLTACATAPDPNSGRSLGEDWRVVNDGPTELYLRRETRSGPWHIAAIVHRGPSDDRDGAAPPLSPVPPGPPALRAQQPRRGGAGLVWRAEYRDFQDGLPRAIRLVADDSRHFDLRLAVSQVEVNGALGADVFHVDVPRSARPMTLEELRDARPGLRKN
jgi:hypothetical protein